MPSDLITSFAQIVSNGLRRRSIVNCSSWAEKCRIMGKPFSGPYSFKYFPWAKAMHDNDDEKWVGQKSSQVGYTEIALNRVFYTIDIKRVDCLYLLPSQSPDASNFSAGRFDPALELSPYLSGLFSDVKNVGHKRAGSTNLYVRGTRSRSQLKSIPAGLIIFDELDEMTQKNLSLAEERQSGQMYHQEIKISTPTIAGTGINIDYNESLQEHFHFQCPHCSRYTELIYPDCLIITAEDMYDPNIANSHLICKECHKILDHDTKHEWLSTGIWVPHNEKGLWSGYHINGLYSSAAARHPKNIALKVFKSKFDPDEEQELYNSVLGQVHEVKGSRLTDADVQRCVKNYELNPKVAAGTLITMGVDQGAEIHFEVTAWRPLLNGPRDDVNLCWFPKVLEIGALLQFEHLDRLMRKWQVRSCVIDAHPEKRKALEFAGRFLGFVNLCYYSESTRSKNIVQWSGEPCITVDRTSWLDLALGRFKDQRIAVPVNIPQDYVNQLKAPVRVPRKDINGNAVAVYITGDRVADHYAHARNYSEIALNFAVSYARNQNMVSPA